MRRQNYVTPNDVYWMLMLINGVVVEKNADNHWTDGIQNAG